jgi:hypothetical protein
MKKQLLIGSVLLASMSTYSQSNQAKPVPSGVINIAEKLAQKYAVLNNPTESTAAKANNSPAPAVEVNIPESPAGLSAVAAPTVQWNAIGGSMNIYGMLVSLSKPLNYDARLNAISFIHRKGTTYDAQPVSNSGAIVAHITTNWGATWDSTCIWSDGTNLARYPQGGIYNPAGNSNINNAYAVGCGPVTGGSGWVGNWYASKQLGAGNYNNTASAAPGAQQFIANTGPFAPALNKHDFSRYSFSTTDNGVVRSIATIYGDVSGTTNQSQAIRGAMIVKGTFNAGTFTWTGDSIIPQTIVRSNGSKQFFGQPMMAWNEAGTVGYVVFIGAAATATGSNKGWQPIVYKTTNSGASWVNIPGIDFNSPAMQPVKDHIATVNTNTNLEVPFFKIDEGLDCIVDADNKLHIVGTLVGTARTHNDSLEYTWQFTNQGVSGYGWGHSPGNRPYVYDFIGDGLDAWTYVTLDSLSSEGPGGSTGAAGYDDNPWDADPNNSGSKVSSDSRLQLGRTPDGQYIVCSWAESDTNFTNNSVKWNTLPNIKARCLLTSPGSSVVTLSPTEINVTRPTPAVPVTYSVNNNVAFRAMFHYQSRTGLFVNCVGSNSVHVNMPFTVSNSNPYSQLTENRIWFSSSTLEFGGLTTCTGIQQNLAYNVNNIDVFPNPANSNATISVDLKEEGRITVGIYNTVGQLLSSNFANGNLGENKINMNVENLSSGIYMVKVQVGNSTSTKKLIVQ